MDADENVIDAVYHVFYLYDAMEPPSDPDNDIGINVEYDIQDFNPHRGAPATSVGEDLLGDNNQGVSNPPNRNGSTSHTALEDNARTPFFVGAQL